MKLFSVGVFFSLLFAASFSFATEYVHKYEITPFFGLKAECTQDGAAEMSQVKINVQSDDLKSNRDLIPASIRISVCLITGGFIMERHEVLIPRFLVAAAAPLQGTFALQHPKFSKISVNELKRDQWQLRYFDKAAKPWSVIDPVEMTLNAAAHRPEKLRFLVKTKNRWIEATYRKTDVR